MKFTRVVFIWLLASICLPVVGRTDIIDFQVNDDGSAVTHEHPRIAANYDGTFLVVWSDQRNGHSDVFLQRYSSSGLPLAANQRINSDTALAWQLTPALDCSADNKFMVVWQDYRNGSYPFGADVYLQRFDSAAQLLAANKNVSIELPDSLKENPDIAVGADGRAVVVWADYRNRNWDIYGQRLNADGSLSGVNFKVNDDQNAAQQHCPRVAVAPQGWFVVTWYDNRQGNDDIFIQRFDQTGNKTGINRRANSDLTTTRQAFPDVSADGRGHFTVVWTDWRNGTYPANPDIYARKFDTLYTPLIIDTRVNRDASVRAQRDPAISADRMGNVGIVWADSGATSWDISGQMIDVDGIVRVANFRANSSVDSAQLQPDIALDGQYRYVAWSDKRAGSFNIYAAVAKYNEMRLLSTPEALHFEMKAGGALPPAQTVLIEHTGFNALGYKAVPSQAWLVSEPNAGTTPETVAVAVAQVLPAGHYAADLVFIDTVNNDSSLAVTATLTVIPQSVDSIVIGAVGCLPLDTVDLPIDIKLTTPVQELTIPLSFDSMLVTAVSAHWDDSLTANGMLTLTLNRAGKVVIRVSANSGDSLPAGGYSVALRLASGTSQGLALIDTVSVDSYSLLETYPGGSEATPAVVAGEVNVNTSTGSGEENDNTLPTGFALAQNYPNPFNSSTEIRFAIPSRADVFLEIFNVLGQRVRVLNAGSLSAGEHWVSWDGSNTWGGEVPSGIYFYRLNVGERSLVHKMIVLK